MAQVITREELINHLQEKIDYWKKEGHRAMVSCEEFWSERKLAEYDKGVAVVYKTEHHYNRDTKLDEYKEYYTDGRIELSSYYEGD